MADRSIAKKVFQRFAGKDNLLSIGELITALHLCGLTPTKTTATELLVKYDKSGDGLLSLKEFYKLCDNVLSKSVDEDSLKQEVVSLYDPQGTGFISHADVAALLAGAGDDPLTTEEVEQTIASIVKASTAPPPAGKVSVDELIKYVSKDAHPVPKKGKAGRKKPPPAPKKAIVPPSQELRKVEDAVRERVAEIVATCKEKGIKYTDPVFKPNATSLWMDPAKPPNPDHIAHPSSWVRLSEMIDKPVVFRDGAEPGDVEQGGLGTCFLLGSLSTISLKEGLLQSVFVAYDVDVGVYGMRLFQNGDWRAVIVDDYIPSVVGQNPPWAGKPCPVFGCNKDPQEVWVALMEKAYAKAYKVYQHIDGGIGKYAMEDFTSGVTQSLNLNAKGHESAAAVFGRWVGKLINETTKEESDLALYLSFNAGSLTGGGEDADDGAFRLTGTYAPSGAFSMGSVYFDDLLSEDDFSYSDGEDEEAGEGEDNDFDDGDGDGDDGDGVEDGDGEGEDGEGDDEEAVEDAEVARMAAKIKALEKAPAVTYSGKYDFEKKQLKGVVEGFEGGKYSFYLNDPSAESGELGPFADLWQQLKHAFGNNSLLSVSMNAKDGEVVETAEEGGLLRGHLYGIVNLVEAEGHRLVCLRNPHAAGEWTGAFSDKDTENWTPDLRKLCNVVDEDDGVFWMEFSDFHRIFEVIDVCQLFSDEWAMRSELCAWEKQLCGGRAKWFNNPQFILHFQSTQKFVIKLSQTNTKIYNGEDEYPIGVGFKIVKPIDGNTDQVDSLRALVIADEPPKAGERAAVLAVTLPPPTNTEQYFLIPYTDTPGVTMPYVLSVYSTAQFELERLFEVMPCIGCYADVHYGYRCQDDGCTDISVCERCYWIGIDEEEDVPDAHYTGVVDQAPQHKMRRVASPPFDCTLCSRPLWGHSYACIDCDTDPLTLLCHRCYVYYNEAVKEHDYDDDENPFYEHSIDHRMIRVNQGQSCDGCTSMAPVGSLFVCQVDNCVYLCEKCYDAGYTDKKHSKDHEVRVDVDLGRAWRDELSTCPSPPQCQPLEDRFEFSRNWDGEEMTFLGSFEQDLEEHANWSEGYSEYSNEESYGDENGEVDDVDGSDEAYFDDDIEEDAEVTERSAVFRNWFFNERDAQLELVEEFQYRTKLKGLGWELVKEGSVEKYRKVGEKTLMDALPDDIAKKMAELGFGDDGEEDDAVLTKTKGRRKKARGRRKKARGRRRKARGRRKKARGRRARAR